MSSSIDETTDLKIERAQNVIMQLNVALKSLQLYPPEHSIPKESLWGLLDKLNEFFKDFGTFIVVVGKDSLRVDGRPVAENINTVKALAFRLFRLKVDQMMIEKRVDERQLAALLAFISSDPEEAAETGGAVDLLWKHRVDAITISQASVKRLREATLEDEPDDEKIDFALLKQILFSQSDPVDIERARLKRQLFGADGRLREFLHYVSGGSRGSNGATIVAQAALPRLISAIKYDTPEEKANIFHDIGAAVLGLDDGLCEEVWAALLIAESSSTKIARRAIFSELSNDELAAALKNAAAGQPDILNMLPKYIGALNLPPARISPLVPALIKTLPIQPSDREGFAGRVASFARPEDAGSRAKPADALEVLAGATAIPTEQLERVREEGSRVDEESIDLETIGVLSALLRLETDTGRYAAGSRAMLRIFSRAFEKDDMKLASTALEAIVRDLRSRYQDIEKATLARKLVAEAGSAEKIDHLMNLMDAHGQFGPADLERYLAHVGNFGILSLMDLLAIEERAGRRRLICQLLISVSRTHLSALESKIMDPRWYLVRNIVSILGRIGDDKVIPILAKTVSHSDARVRLEAVRALAGFGEKALEPLSKFSADVNRSVKLEAIKAIGRTRRPEAVEVLAGIINHRDLLNRNMDFKVTAIEALGMLRSDAALPVLVRLSRGGALFQTPQVRSAVRAAIARIQAGRGSE